MVNILLINDVCFTMDLVGPTVSEIKLLLLLFYNVVSHPKDTGKVCLAKRGKRNCQSSSREKFLPQWGSNPAGNVRSPLQGNALTRSATAPRLLSTCQQLF